MVVPFVVAFSMMFRAYMDTRCPSSKESYDDIKRRIRCFYINLDKRTDRMLHMEIYRTKHSVVENIERLSAVVGREACRSKNIDALSRYVTWHAIEDMRKKNLKYGQSLTMGAVGCMLSHAKLWQALATSKNLDWVYMMVMEDDVQLDTHFDKEIKNTLTKIPLDTDIIFLGWHKSSSSFLWRSMDGYPYLKRVTGWVYGMHCYFITKSGAIKLMSMFPIDKQIDTVIGRMIRRGELHAYSARRKLATSSENMMGTDIQITNKLNIITPTPYKLLTVQEAIDINTQYI